MHLRYDMQNKLDVTNFDKQATYFLNKENCSFSFYLTDFAINFDVTKQIENTNIIDLKITISELSAAKQLDNQESKIYLSIDPNVDIRFSGLSLMNELFAAGSNVGYCQKNSVKDSIDFMIMLVKVIFKLNKLSIII